MQISQPGWVLVPGSFKKLKNRSLFYARVTGREACSQLSCLLPVGSCAHSPDILLFKGGLIWISCRIFQFLKILISLFKKFSLEDSCFKMLY